MKPEEITDTDRIDWLADINNRIGQVLLPTAVVEANVHSLRDAIDAAMRLPQPEPEDTTP